LPFFQQASLKIHENSKNFVKGRFISLEGFLQPWKSFTSDSEEGEEDPEATLILKIENS